MEEEIIGEDTRRADRPTRQANLPPNGSGGHAPTRGSSAGAYAEGTTTSGMTPPTAVIHLRFGTPDPPTIPHRARGGTVQGNINTTYQQNRFTPLREHGSESRGRGSEATSARILREGSASAASSSIGSRGRDPIPLTPEIFLLLDRLEPDK